MQIFHNHVEINNMKMKECLGSILSLHDRQVLLVQPLLAEVEELELPGKVLSDNHLGGLLNLGLVDVSVDLREDVNFL